MVESAVKSRQISLRDSLIPTLYSDIEDSNYSNKHALMNIMREFQQAEYIWISPDWVPETDLQSYIRSSLYTAMIEALSSFEVLFKSVIKGDLYTLV